MKFTSKVNVAGIKGSKGQIEGGQAFDSTKVYVVTELDDSKEMGKGFATAEYNFGLSDNFHKFKHLNFPLDCEIEMEIVTNGKTQKTLITALRPVETLKSKAA